MSKHKESRDELMTDSEKREDPAHKKSTKTKRLDGTVETLLSVLNPCYKKSAIRAIAREFKRLVGTPKADPFQMSGGQIRQLIIKSIWNALKRAPAEFFPKDTDDNVEYFIEVFEKLRESLFEAILIRQYRHYLGDKYWAEIVYFGLVYQHARTHLRHPDPLVHICPKIPYVVFRKDDWNEDNAYDSRRAGPDENVLTAAEGPTFGEYVAEGLMEELALHIVDNDLREDDAVLMRLWMGKAKPAQIVKKPRFQNLKNNTVSQRFKRGFKKISRHFKPQSQNLLAEIDEQVAFVTQCLDSDNVTLQPLDEYSSGHSATARYLAYRAWAYARAEAGVSIDLPHDMLEVPDPDSPEWAQSPFWLPLMLKQLSAPAGHALLELMGEIREEFAAGITRWIP